LRIWSPNRFAGNVANAVRWVISPTRLEARRRTRTSSPPSAGCLVTNEPTLPPAPNTSARRRGTADSGSPAENPTSSHDSLLDCDHLSPRRSKRETDTQSSGSILRYVSAT
jgi:hypothetical protein